MNTEIITLYIKIPDFLQIEAIYGENKLVAFPSSPNFKNIINGGNKGHY